MYPLHAIKFSTSAPTFLTRSMTSLKSWLPPWAKAARSSISIRAENVFGARQKASLEDGIRNMAAWVKDHGCRESKIFEDIEIPKNLPPSWASVARVRV